MAGLFSSSPSPDVSPTTSRTRWQGGRLFLGETVDDIPPIHQGARTAVDGVFVKFLIDYAAYETECPPLFKAYLQDVVLKPGSMDLRLQVERHLRNPEIKDFGLGPVFLREFERYSMYDQVFPGLSPQPTPPSVPIPEQYQPSVILTPAHLTGAAFEAPEVFELSLDEDEDVEEGGLAESGKEEMDYNDDDGDYDGDYDDGDYDDGDYDDGDYDDGDYDDGDYDDAQVRRTMANRLRTLQRETPRHRGPSAPAALRRRAGVSVPPIRSRNAVGADGRGQGNDRLAVLLQRLESIPLLSRTGDFLEGDERMGGYDWEVESWYRGRRQPPLAARLDTIVKFLAEEDVDRCLDWETKFEEIVSYLEWLALEDGNHQLEGANPQTQAMFNDAVTKAKVHVLFEKHHYDPTTLELAKPPKNPLRSTRLDWMVNPQDWPIQSRNVVPDRRNLLPRAALPRPPSPVNRMLLDRPQDSHLYDKLAEDEKGWWQRIADNDVDDPDDIPADAENAIEQQNLAYTEDRAFHSPSNTTGAILTDPTTDQTILPDGTALRRGTPTDWATERGARRARLQHTLRVLSPTTTTTTTTGGPPRGGHLVLPTPAVALRPARSRADGPHWTPPSLALSQLPPADELETMAHTLGYRARLRRIKTARELARVRVAEEEEEDEGGEGGREAPRLSLPRNLVSGGPFVWRMVDAGAQARQDLLRECRVAAEMLRAAGRRVPRPLLKAVLRVVRKGLEGGDDQGVADGVRLEGDDWERAGAGAGAGSGPGWERTVPRLADLDEVAWLKFLAGECVNARNWTGRFVPDTPKDKYRLFLLFATKVQKLLDDKNPQGLFSLGSASVEVEDLLKVINAGKDSSAVTKHQFQPSDACCWLDRMKQTGHVRFHLDPIRYGVVKRPEIEYFPEHRVIWPTDADDRSRPSYRLGYVSDWARVIRDGHKPDISEGSPVWNFFLSLAFRLGYTISELEQASTQQQRQQPIPTRALRDAINKWARTCARLQAGDSDGSPDPTARELALIRTRVIDELHANKTMLHPAREHHTFDADGNRHTTLVRDHNWDWAAAGPENGARRQFWSIDRWPTNTHTDAVDPRMAYDPAAADPTTDRRYTRPRPRPYGHEVVQFRPGPAVYPVGDTRLQREVLRGRMVEMVERAAGLDGWKQPRTWGDALARLNPLSCLSSRARLGEEEEEEEEEEGRLPPVNPKAIPSSWDPLEAAERRAADEMESDYGSEEGDEEDDLGSVDVLMTGMREP